MKKSTILLPKAQKTASILGENIKLARLRRKYSTRQVSGRANTVTLLQSSFIAFVLLVSGLFFANAQPSGGPYGPINQTYDLPKVSGKIYYVAPDGKTESQGDQFAQPTTIESAIANVKTGDAIVLRGGTYRSGDLEFNQGITIQPYADERPIFKGTFEAKEWKKIKKGLWKTSWTHFFPGSPDDWWSRDRFGKETPLHVFNNDMVFVDGKILKST